MEITNRSDTVGKNSPTKYVFNQKTGFEPFDIWQEVLEDIVENRVEVTKGNADDIRNEVCQQLTNGCIKVIADVDEDTLAWEMRLTRKGRLAQILYRASGK